ncbi:hypothetical protein ACRALDRAFT_212572 [Sodiomyces alcalophilus JCM 7366]|uniref:uncharacterized protein n=1 Tax=Sodiomyces alcalophilus JCM 7366 TaxID=591952 RepID=UPI0039B43A97
MQWPDGTKREKGLRQWRSYKAKASSSTNSRPFLYDDMMRPLSSPLVRSTWPEIEDQILSQSGDLDPLSNDLSLSTRACNGRLPNSILVYLACRSCFVPLDLGLEEYRRQSMTNYPPRSSSSSQESLIHKGIVTSASSNAVSKVTSKPHPSHSTGSLPSSRRRVVSYPSPIPNPKPPTTQAIHPCFFQSAQQPMNNTSTEPTSKSSHPLTINLATGLFRPNFTCRLSLQPTARIGHFVNLTTGDELDERRSVFGAACPMNNAMTPPEQKIYVNPHSNETRLQAQVGGRLLKAL